MPALIPQCSDQTGIPLPLSLPRSRRASNLMQALTWAREFLGVGWELATQVRCLHAFLEMDQNTFSACFKVAICAQKLTMGHVPELPDVGASAEGLTIIVTGPTGGIGQQSAAELARRGAKGTMSERLLLLGDHRSDYCACTIFFWTLFLQLSWRAGTWRRAMLTRRSWRRRPLLRTKPFQSWRYRVRVHFCRR